MLFHRCSLGLLGIQKPAVEIVANLMRTLLDWDQAETEQQLNRVMQRLSATQNAIQSGN
jgi:F0F1-type ATP synthase epsilon subunit